MRWSDDDGEWEPAPGVEILAMVVTVAATVVVCWLIERMVAA